MPPLQSGLFDEKLGGLWLNAAYGRPALTWWAPRSPTLPRHSATALAAVTYFMLLAQGRLVDQAGSNEIAQVLKLKCAHGGVLDGIETLPGVRKDQSPNKCGIISQHYHEAAPRQSGKSRVASVFKLRRRGVKQDAAANQLHGIREGPRQHYCEAKSLMRSRALQPPHVEAAVDVRALASGVIKKSVQENEAKKGPE